MNTRLLLHGGYLKLKDKRNDAYFAELTKELRDGDKVLFIGFARTDNDDRNQQFKHEEKWILNQTGKDIQVLNAQEDRVIEQIKDAKTVQITGGQPDKLVEKIQQYPDFLPALSGKLVAGSSAGACLFSTYYFEPDSIAVKPGLGVLPIRLFVHNNNPNFGDRNDALSKLARFDNRLELVTLNECAWVERRVDLV